MIAAAVAVVVLVTAGLAVLPFTRYAYEAPGLQIALNTADGVVAALVGYLAYGRYRQSGRVRDLLLASSLGVLAVANLPLAAVPQALAAGGDSAFGAWGALFVRTLGGALFAAAALTSRSARVSRRTARKGVAAVAGGVVWLAVIGILAAERLPPAVPAVVREASDPWLASHPLVLAAQGLGVALYASAAFAFARAGTRERDEFLHWLAAAAVLAAGARVNYLLFPSLYSDFLYSGDLLRMGFYLLLVVGAAREIRSYWSARLGAAVARGRRDAFREVEDVVVHDLRVVLRRTEDLQGSVGAPATPAVEAAREALEDVEQVLRDVRREVETVAADEPVEVRLRDAVSAIATRRGLRVDVRVLPGADVPQRSEAVLGLACEAVRGAARHGNASAVTITLSSDPLRLVVQDDGVALQDSATERAAGLQRMRSRADDSGGALTVSSAPGGGTTVIVDWL